MTKSYSPEERAAAVAAAKGGERVPDLARRLGINLATAYRWMREADGGARALLKQPAFVELVTTVATCGLTVRIGSAEIEVHAGFDADLLRAVVRALGGAA